MHNYHDETWRPVPDWEGFYEVSDAGRVRSVRRLIEHSDGRRRVYPSVLLKQYGDKYGYRKVTLKRNGADRRVHVHVLVAAAFHGPRPAGMEVCHNDGMHLNNRAGNLRYDTPAGNRADCVKHGTAGRPTMRKLSNEEVAAIRAMRGKVSQADLAAQYGTSKTHVCNIQRGNRRTLL